MSTCLDDLNTTLAAIQAALELALHDTGWLSWPNPVISQPGALSLSATNLADYRVAAGIVDARLNVIVSSAGTSGQKIVLTGLPVQPRNNGVNQPLCYGFFIFEGTIYGAIGTPNGTGGVIFVSGAAGGIMGENPTVGMVSGDGVNLNFRYRAAGT